MNPTVLRSSLVLAALAAALTASAQNLVTDGDFESATLSSLACYASGESLGDGSWFAADPLVDAYGNVFVETGFLISGAKTAQFDHASILQTIPTVAGRTYEISFDLRGGQVSFGGGGGGADTPFVVGFSSAPTNLIMPPSPFGTDYPIEHFSFTQTATSASTVLRLYVGFVLAFDNVSI